MSRYRQAENSEVQLSHVYPRKMKTAHSV